MSIQAQVTPAQENGVGGEPDKARAALRIDRITKTFKRANGTTITPIDNVSLSVAAGEFLVLLGPSGCGKTTLLRCIAGLESPDEGRIEILGRRVIDKQQSGRGLDVPPEKRQLGMIFQSYALWPHLTVARNVAYPLEAAKVPKAERKERVEKAMKLVGISEIAEQLPGRLSGGQQQRVSLARALVGEPQLILFDEPLSNVDAKVREELRLQLIEMQTRIGFTAIYVTHDQAEAMELADRVAVLRDGQIEQLGAPEEVYMRPASRYVAKFVGIANEVGAVVTRVTPQGLTVRIEGSSAVQNVPLPVGEVAVAEGDKVWLIWRPERTSLDASPQTDSLRLEGSFLFSRYLGTHGEAVVEVAGAEIRANTPRVHKAERGSGISISVARDDVRVFASGAEG